MSVTKHENEKFIPERSLITDPGCNKDGSQREGVGAGTQGSMGLQVTSQENAIKRIIL